LLLQWRRSFRVEQEGGAEQGVGFVPARVVADSKPAVPPPVGLASGGVIEIEFAGVRMRITGTVDKAAVTAAIAALANGRQR